MRKLDATRLDRAGLNLQAVFDLERLPAPLAADLRARFDPARRYRQLILIGHAGRTLWSALQAEGASGPATDDPIDDFSVRTVERWLAEQFAGEETEATRAPEEAGRKEEHGAGGEADAADAAPRHAIIYPGEHAVGLQALGKLAGWHRPSPLMIGIDERWGTWFAYRVALLADTDLEPTAPVRGASPCARCAERFCAAACPAGALDGAAFALDKCVAWRKRPDSPCRTTCLARLACPVGAEHRYEEAQIRHTYSRSLQAIERYCP